MIVFHRTSHAAAAAILADGFLDGSGDFGIGRVMRGVWLSDRPLSPHEGAAGDVLLSLEVSDRTFEEFEWVEDGKPYREALIPAATVNSEARNLHLVDDEEAVLLRMTDEAQGTDPEALDRFMAEHDGMTPIEYALRTYYASAGFEVEQYSPHLFAAPKKPPPEGIG